MTHSSPLSTYFLNMTYAESFDVSYMVYINTFVNIMEETSSNDRIKNNELGVELRKSRLSWDRSCYLPVFIRNGRTIK
jgi:hypothetical protein